jgi:hypothetical protein
MAIKDIISTGRGYFEEWREYIVDPTQKLSAGFEPTEEQLNDGIEFYLVMFVIAFLLTAPVTFMHKGETIDKLKVAINAALGLLFMGLFSIAWYVAFWVMGGKTGLSGTLLAYIYAASPYLPIYSFCALIMVSGVPRRLQPYVVNPATSKTAMDAAMQDPETSKGLVGIGSLAVLGLIIWCLYVVWSCFSYIHDVTGWRLAGAVGIALLIAIPVNYVLKGVGSIFQGQTGLDSNVADGI